MVCWVRMSRRGVWWPGVIFNDWASLRRWGLKPPCKLPTVTESMVAVYFLGPMITYASVCLVPNHVQPFESAEVPESGSKKKSYLSKRHAKDLAAAIAEALELIGHAVVPENYDSSDRAVPGQGSHGREGAGELANRRASKSHLKKKDLTVGDWALMVRPKMDEPDVCLCNAPSDSCELFVACTTCSKW